MNHEDTDVPIGAQVTALKCLAVATLATLGNRDAAIVREVLDALPTRRPGVDSINPFHDQVAVALDNILKNIRDKLPRE